MKRDYEEDDSAEEEEPPPKISRTHSILENLHKGLTETEDVNQQLIETQKQYFTVYLEKLMHQIPMGQSVIETIRKNGQKDDFMYMYTASKTIVQSLLSVKQTKATKAVVDMMAGVMCRYVHDRVISPMLVNVVGNEHLKQAYHAYQASVNKEDNEAELEMRCLLHTIHELLEKEHGCLKTVHPFTAQMTQQMKAISEYVVALLLSVSKPSNEQSKNPKDSIEIPYLKDKNDTEN